MATYVILFSYVNKVNKNYLRHFSVQETPWLNNGEAKAQILLRVATLTVKMSQPRVTEDMREGKEL